MGERARPEKRFPVPCRVSVVGDEHAAGQAEAGNPPGGSALLYIGSRYMCELGGDLLTRECIEAAFVEHSCRIATNSISAIETLATPWQVIVAVFCHYWFLAPDRYFPELARVVKRDENPCRDKYLFDSVLIFTYIKPVTRVIVHIMGDKPVARLLYRRICEPPAGKVTQPWPAMFAVECLGCDMAEAAPALLPHFTRAVRLRHMCRWQGMILILGL